MEEGGDLLELFGSDLVPHWQSPVWNRGSILPTRAPGPPRSFDGVDWAVLLIRSTEPIR